MRAVALAAAVAVAVSGCRPAGPGRPEPVADPALPNAFRLTAGVFSGGQPHGDDGFAALRRLGVRTVISVDGAIPDVAAARRHGLRYAHLPVGYDGIPRDKAVALARAVRHLPGPVYVHCHHGKHRGPAAVAAALLCLDGGWSPADAAGWLAAAGTDPRYRGLMAVPRSTARPTADELAAPADFPEVADVPDLTRRMVAVDEAWDELKAAAAAGWKAPPGHPDADPPHHALQLAEHLTEAARMPTAGGRGPDFVAAMQAAAATAEELERALRATPVAAAAAEAAFGRSAAHCRDCHRRFRD